MAEPQIIKTVLHRDGTTHLAIVQKRSRGRVRKYGGKLFASWARRVVDGLPTGAPERFETYDTEAEAVSHALYAAGAPKSKAERSAEKRRAA